MNYYCDACLWAWHPRVKDTTSFHWIISQHCCFTTVGMIYCWCLLVCLASLWKRHYILSLDCQSILLLHDSRYAHESRQVEVMLTVVSYRSRDRR